MKQILILLITLMAFDVYGQNVPFGASRAADTSKTVGSLYVGGNAVIKGLVTTDTNKVLKVNSYGKIVLGSVSSSGGVTDQQLADTAATKVPWAAVTPVPTANYVPQYLAGGNLAANNIFLRSTSTTSAGGTTTLNVNSARMQVLTGSANQTYKMPNATTLSDNTVFEFNNNSTGNLYIIDNGSNALYTMPAGSFARLTCLSTATSNGVWEANYSLPHNIQAGDGGINFSTSSAITGSVDWNGNKVTAPYIDTFGMATRARLQKVADSINANVGERVKYTDTSTMLSHYLRFVDSSVYSTKAYRQKGIDSVNGTIAGKIGYSDTTYIISTKAYRQKGIDSVNGNIALKLNIADTTGKWLGIGTQFFKYSDTSNNVSTRSWRQKGIDSVNVNVALKATTITYFPADTTISAAYTLTSRDFHRTIHCTNSSNIALTIPTGLGTTFECVVLTESTGTVTPTASSTTLKYQPTSTTKIKTDGGATIRSYATANTYLIIGSLE